MPPNLNPFAPPSGWKPYMGQTATMGSKPFYGWENQTTGQHVSTPTYGAPFQIPGSTTTPPMQGGVRPNTTYLGPGGSSWSINQPGHPPDPWWMKGGGWTGGLMGSDAPPRQVFGLPPVTGQRRVFIPGRGWTGGNPTQMPVGRSAGQPYGVGDPRKYGLSVWQGAKNQIPFGALPPPIINKNDPNNTGGWRNPDGTWHIRTRAEFEREKNTPFLNSFSAGRTA